MRARWIIGLGLLGVVGCHKPPTFGQAYMQAMQGKIWAKDCAHTPDYGQVKKCINVGDAEYFIWRDGAWLDTGAKWGMPQ